MNCTQLQRTNEVGALDFGMARVRLPQSADSDFEHSTWKTRSIRQENRYGSSSFASAIIEIKYNEEVSPLITNYEYHISLYHFFPFIKIQINSAHKWRGSIPELIEHRSFLLCEERKKILVALVLLKLKITPPAIVVEMIFLEKYMLNTFKEQINLSWGYN